MLFELIATLVAGFAGAGVGLLLVRISGGRLPKWLVPVAAGAAMLTATIVSEYGWYGRTRAALPEGMEVAMTVNDDAIYRPWARIVPFVSRFLAVDLPSLRTNDALPGQRLVDIYAFGRWTAPQRQLIAADCETGARANVPPGAQIAADGRIEGLDWHRPEAGDPILALVCGT